MNSKVITTLTYLHSLLNIEDDELLISITKDEIRLSYLSDILTVQKVAISHVNPIKNILDHINEQMCTDCLSIDYLYKDDFFLNLVCGYIESLVHEFGTRIPITQTLAEAMVRHNILPTYKVILEVNCKEYDLRLGVPYLEGNEDVNLYLEV